MQVHHSQLIIDLQKKSKIQINNSNDIKFLKEEIFSETTHKISFNTLRRFFGFLQATKPSKKTLDILANYLGFNSYSNYLNNREIYSEWYFKMKMLRMQLNSESLLKKNVLIFNIALKNENHIDAISGYVCFLIEQNKVDSLDVFFKYFNYNVLSESCLLKFCIYITYSFYKIKTEQTIAIYKVLLKHDSFKFSVPLFFIDYNHLNGYYLKVIQLIKEQNDNESDYLFCSLMEFIQKYLSNQSYSEVNIKFPNKIKNIHPVLKGRYLGYLILKEEQLNNKTENLIKKELKVLNPSLLLIEVIPALILKNEYEFLKCLIDKYYEQIFELEKWTSKSTAANYLIGLATVNVYNNNLKAAKSNLELVELDKVELAYTDYIALFYYYTKIKLYNAEGLKEKTQFYFEELKRIANKMKFYHFITLSEKHISK